MCAVEAQSDVTREQHHEAAAGAPDDGDAVVVEGAVEQRHRAERQVEGAEQRRAPRVPAPLAAEEQIERVAVAVEAAARTA